MAALQIGILVKRGRKVARHEAKFVLIYMTFVKEIQNHPCQTFLTIFDGLKAWHNAADQMYNADQILIPLTHITRQHPQGFQGIEELSDPGKSVVLGSHKPGHGEIHDIGPGSVLLCLQNNADRNETARVSALSAFDMEGMVDHRVHDTESSPFVKATDNRQKQRPPQRDKKTKGSIQHDSQG
ncbi:hypothetical protein CAPTEDRAFT_207701 [Capitella teleta]|uniref:Uncharacterized protein n=1 Tax=Capitella teleta TaxID=283909 RepID=R7TBR9_CAPTE|nr:hypothetical protein CAPTEDRAFT_207701 [Capitella teleta]|eukprot:ELT91173.1 hypothetical protein CAPTEDRAFT_207701 [Capitella teleta]